MRWATSPPSASAIQIPSGLAKYTYSISRHTLMCLPSAPPEFTGPPNLYIGPENLFSGDQECKNNNSNECQDTKDKGPIPEGDYEMSPYDGTRPNSDNWWRLRPESAFTRAMASAGLGRGGHLLHPGSVSLGCITFRTDNEIRLKQYNDLHEFLRSEQGNNWLKVIP